MTKEYLMNRLTDYCEKVGNKVMMSVEDVISILNEDTDIRYKIHSEIERENHKEDVRSEIEERQQGHLIDCECEWENEYIKKLESLTDEDIECITDKYEDYLSECEYNWRVCLENAIDEFLG